LLAKVFWIEHVKNIELVLALLSLLPSIIIHTMIQAFPLATCSCICPRWTSWFFTTASSFWQVVFAVLGYRTLDWVRILGYVVVEITQDLLPFRMRLEKCEEKYIQEY